MTFPSAFHPSATGANSRANAGLLFPILSTTSQTGNSPDAGGGQYPGRIRAFFQRVQASFRGRWNLLACHGHEGQRAASESERASRPLVFRFPRVLQDSESGMSDVFQQCRSFLREEPSEEGQAACAENLSTRSVK